MGGNWKLRGGEWQEVVLHVWSTVSMIDLPDFTDIQSSKINPHDLSPNRLHLVDWRIPCVPAERDEQALNDMTCTVQYLTVFGCLAFWLMGFPVLFLAGSAAVVDGCDALRAVWCTFAGFADHVCIFEAYGALVMI